MSFLKLKVIREEMIVLAPTEFRANQNKKLKDHTDVHSGLITSVAALVNVIMFKQK